MEILNKGKKVLHIIYLKIKEKKYKRISYVFKAGKSDVLFISFAGFSKKGHSPRYNYVNTLKDFSANQLFLLDNYGYNKAGSYYLGENGNWFMPDEIIELINKVIIERNIDKVVTLGSSKGGSAALYYGLMINADDIIIGAPQYYLGNYLSGVDRLDILKGIQGSTDDKAIDELNMLLPSTILNCSSERKSKVYVHCSPCEHTYDEHVKDMIGDLKKNGYDVLEDIQYSYSAHGQVGIYFIPFLHKVCSEIMKDM